MGEDLTTTLLIVIPLTIIAGVLLGLLLSRSLGRAASGPPASNRPVVPARELDERAIDEIDALLAADQKIPAIKTLRMHTGESLVEAKNRIDTWDSPAERQALRTGAAGGTGAHEDVRAIEARAIIRTSGWQRAEAYLRDHHGMSAEEAAAFLRGLGTV